MVLACFLIGGLTATIALAFFVAVPVWFFFATEYAALPTGLWEGYAIIVGGLGGVGTFMLSSGFRLRDERRQYSVKLLQKFQEDEGIRASFSALARLSGSEKFQSIMATEGPAGILTSEDPDLKHFYKHMSVFGNFMEEMAIAVLGGGAADPPLFAFFSGMCVRSFRVVKPFLPLMRGYRKVKTQDGFVMQPRDESRPEVYENAEELFRRWAKRHDKKVRGYVIVSSQGLAGAA